MNLFLLGEIPDGFFPEVGVPWLILWTTVFAAIFCAIVFFAFRKTKPDKKPSFFQTAIESFITGFDNLMDSITGKKLRKAYPYFLTLLIYLVSAVVIGFFGFDSPAISIFFTFTLGTITFIGIYVVGITSKGIWGFIKHKYANPLELFQQFAPLLSISIRLFGATFGFTIILLIPQIVAYSLDLNSLGTYWPLISFSWNWAPSMVDMFLSLIQAFVFAVLTATYWSLETNSEEEEERKKAKKQNKKTKNK